LARPGLDTLDLASVSKLIDPPRLCAPGLTAFCLKAHLITKQKVVVALGLATSELLTEYAFTVTA
jgi:hypothetical protein